jgi:enoyl-CoA hydratase
MSQSKISLSEGGRIATVTIDRPQARNALNRELIRELTDTFVGFNTASDLRCVLLTGSGDEALCAGADLEQLRSSTDPQARREFFNSIANMIQAIKSCPVPVVCAIHGFALAGGLGLVAASDIALASDDAVFGLPEVAIGLAPMVVLKPLLEICSPRAMAKLAFSAERITATEALSVGLVSAILPKADLLNHANKLAQNIARHAPDAIRATKVALREARQTPINQLADHSALVSLSTEASEGIAAFFEKRTPNWR